jgi:hypothetical protein
MTHGRGAIRPAVLLLVYGALAVAWTWPLAARMSWRIPHDPGDPLLVTWMMWWNTQVAPLTSTWWNAPIFFPLRGAFALSEHVLGMAIFTTPIQLAGGSALFAYNAALMLSFALSGFFSFLLVRQLTGSTAAAFCAGVAYGFAPYRASQLSHLQVLTSEWMPLALYALHRYLETPRPRLLVLFGAAVLIQGLSHGYYIFFFGVLFACWLAWFVDWRREGRRGFAIVAAYVIASLPLVPVLWTYRQVQGQLGLSRSLPEILQYSATFDAFKNVPPMLAIWPDGEAQTGENYLFTGVTVVALLVAGFLVRWVAPSGGTASHGEEVRLKPEATGEALSWLPPSGGRAEGDHGSFRQPEAIRRTFLFYALAAVLMYWLAMGPAAPGAGVGALAHPYTLLMWLPGFTGLRVAARFAMLGVLCLSTAAGLALARLMTTSPGMRKVLLPLVMLGLVVDGWMHPMPLGVPPGRLELPEVRNGAVLELPADDARVSIAAMYRSIAHGYPVINGYSGYTPPHYMILTDSMHRDDPSAVLELARGRALVIVISDRYDEGGHFRRFAESLPGIERQGGGSGGTLYVLPPMPRASTPPPGAAIPYTLRELPRAHVVLDLGSTHVVRTVEFPLYRNYRRLGKRLAIETSLDGESWTMGWLDWTGGPAMAAALEDPKRVTVKLTLRDASARYLRIHPAPEFVWREMLIRGPG